MWNSSPHTHSKKEFWNIIWFLSLPQIWESVVFPFWPISLLFYCLPRLNPHLRILLFYLYRKYFDVECLQSIVGTCVFYVFQKSILMCLRMGEVRSDSMEQLSRKPIQWQELKKWWISSRERKRTGWRLTKSPGEKHLSDNLYRQTM